MVKGVNRNVIEIVDTGSDLFERAILFVRPEGRGADPAHLESCAHSFLARTKIKRRTLRGAARPMTWIRYIFAAAAGAGLAVLLMYM